MSRRDHDLVVAEYANYEKAAIGLKVLDMRGFGDDRVSVVTRNDPQLVDLERARRDRVTDPSKTGSSGAGAALAAGASAPIAIGTLVAPFFLIGPIAAAVAGAAAGALLGPDKNLPPTEETVRSYQERVANGSVLVIVHATDDDLLEAHGGLKTTDTISLETFRTR